MQQQEFRTFLDDVPVIDWTDFAASSRASIAVLRRLANDPALLRDLLLSVPHDDRLWKKCESHSLDDKIVLYDGLGRNGFRIRLRLATAYQDERPHAHRFTFSTFIMRGSYIQTLYHSQYETQEELVGRFFTSVVDRQERAGSAFTIRHDTLHSTIAPPDTVSLILRGPAMKDRAIIAHQATGEVWWRMGEGQEDAERRAAVRMDRERYDFWVDRLGQYGLI
ncbi:MAG: hypothetical protein M3O36_15050 [Myxococcota bacterium]|nr:hypothetical protein [Myxococcota bacterium]